MQTIESLLTEKEALEKSIAVSRVDLRVLVASNQDLREAIKKQDAQLELKTQQLKDIRNGNDTSLDLVKAEKVSAHEKSEKEIEHKLEYIKLLELNEAGFNDLRKENDDLRSTIATLRHQIQQTEIKHGKCQLIMY
jgi:multidrug resistance efflux pump